MGLKEAATETQDGAEEGHRMVNGFREPAPIAFKSAMSALAVWHLEA